MCYELEKICSLQELNASDKFILLKSAQNFKRGKRVEIFMAVNASTCGFPVVSLKTGENMFEYELGGLVAKLKEKWD